MHEKFKSARQFYFKLYNSLSLKFKVGYDLQHGSSIDDYQEQNIDRSYISNLDDIVDKFLYNEERLSLKDLNFENYDLTSLCRAIYFMTLNDDDHTLFVKKFIAYSINTLYEDADNDFIFCQTLDLKEFFTRELTGSEKQTTATLNILFDGVDFSKFKRDMIDLYREIFGELLSFYFDAYNDRVKRAKCEDILFALEKKIEAIQFENIKTELYKSLILSVTTYGGSGDWSKCPSGYSYHDIMFLNKMFAKYGGFNLNELLIVVNKLHLKKLLPYILLSIRDSFKAALTRKNFANIIRGQRSIVLKIIFYAFFEHNVQIKRDDDLIKAFEDILEMLVDLGFEEAAIILDEFRVH